MRPEASPSEPVFDHAALLAAVREMGAALGELRTRVRRLEAKPRATQRAALREKARTGLLRPARLAATTPMAPPSEAVPSGPLLEDWVPLTQLAGIERPDAPQS